MNYDDLKIEKEIYRMGRLGPRVGVKLAKKSQN